MPVEVEATSQLEDALQVLRKRVRWVLIPLSLCLAFGTSFAIIVPKKFVASERIMVRDVGGRDARMGTAGGQVASHVIRAPNRVKAVIEAIGWPWASLTKLERELLMERTIDNLSVSSPVMASTVKEQIVTIAFAHTQPEQAYRFTKEISLRWREEVLEASRNATRNAFVSLGDRRAQMQERLDEISLIVSAKHKENGIPPWDGRAGGERPLPPEFDALDGMRLERQTLADTFVERSAEVVALEQAYDKMEDMVAFESTDAGQSFADRMAQLQAAISEQELRLSSEGYRPRHSEYMRIQNTISLAKAEMARLTDEQTGSLAPKDLQPNPAKLKAGEDLRVAQAELIAMDGRLGDLDSRMKNMDARIRELQTVYQDLHDLQAERARLNGNLTEVEDEYTRMDVIWTEMQSSAGNPFHLLKGAELPNQPTEPSVPLIILGSAVLGLVLGLGSAFLVEYGRNCFRTVNDITRVMAVPILGTVNSIVVARQRRRARWARAVLVFSTLFVVVGVAFTTWAWKTGSTHLPEGLRESIDGWERSLR